MATLVCATRIRATRIRATRVRGWLGIALLACLPLIPAAAGAAESTLLALCYHDVVESADAAMDPTTVTVDTLVQQLSWLDAEGYQPISLATWAAAGRGEATLPDKPVLLSFDDGYASFHRHVLPLLELFEFPAVLAPVTSWIDAPAGARVQYGDELVDRDRFMTWAQIREARDTGLVEVASHSHDLHRGIPGNPFGNTQPAAVTRRYHPDAAGYESEPAYRARVHDDLKHSVELIEHQLGVAPAAIVWPYGAYGASATASARSLGLEYSLTLDGTANVLSGNHIHRRLIGSDMDLAAFVMAVRGLYPQPAVRAAHVDLDYVYDADPQQQARNLDRLLDRIKTMRINRVFLQAYADPDGNGVADALYFPNRHLPMRADLFNRVAWQLRTRAGVAVWAWMPVLAFELADQDANRALAVTSVDGSHQHRYHRLSPFHPETRRIVAEIYADLGRSSQFAGVLFHDDAFLTDREDVSAAAQAFYRDHWSELLGDAMPVDPLSLGDDAAWAFARAKTRHLIEFTDHLTEVLRRDQPALVTARNLYARVVMEPDSERWFAQNLALFLAHYDYTALMAMPYLENVRRPRRWLADLAARVAAHPDALARTVFELQTRDWNSGKALSERTLKRDIDVLMDAGVRHIAWYPDDFIGAHPPLRLIRSRLSLSDHPALLE